MAGASRPLRVLLLITEDWYFWSHRRGLARALVDAGHELVLATRVHDLGPSIEALGVRLEPIAMDRSGRNPVRELGSVLELVRLYRRVRPDIVHHVGVKPMLYGSWAARLAGVGAVVNAQPGFGYVFSAAGFKATLIRWCIQAAYRSAWVGRRTRVIFQNRETLDFFLGRKLVARECAVLVRGTGVDLEEFRVVPEPEGEPVVMLAGRLLWDKGIGETVEAARGLRAAVRRFRLVVVGRPDVANPKAVAEAQLRAWHEAGDLEWWGYRRDMPEVLAQATLVVLPSYAEGLPKVLVEAAAVGRAIVTTDVPGCREVVRDGVNGLLVAPREVEPLAEAIDVLLADAGRRREMALAGRRIAEEEFSLELVCGQIQAVYRELVDA
jgi:glycosyltransferase involved in cell wall biosynthesis